MFLLSATTEWYIPSITYNFLGFIRYIYSLCDGGDSFFFFPSTPQSCPSYSMVLFMESIILLEHVPRKTTNMASCYHFANYLWKVCKLVIS